MIDFGSFFADYGGETADEVQQRTVNTLQEILNETNKHNVVVVSHGMFYRYLRIHAYH